MGLGEKREGGGGEGERKASFPYPWAACSLVPGQVDLILGCPPMFVCPPHGWTDEERLPPVEWIMCRPNRLRAMNTKLERSLIGKSTQTSQKRSSQDSLLWSSPARKYLKNPRGRKRDGTCRLQRTRLAHVYYTCRIRIGGPSVQNTHT